MTEASEILQNRSTEIDLLVAESLEREDKLTAQQKWARPYLRFVIVVFGLNMLSAALFIAFVNRPVYDDQYNVHDVEIYAQHALSKATILSHRNPPGPTGFLWMAAGARLLGGEELRGARIANLISWVLLLAGVMLGARYSVFAQLWYAAFLVALVFPHSLMAAATTLTEGPALLFAVLGALLWIESASRPEVTRSSFSLLMLGGLLMGIAVSCRQYYLALLPAALLFALIQMRWQATNQNFSRLCGAILSICVGAVPVVFLILTWGGITSPGTATGTSSPDWKAYADLNLFRPVIAAFYCCFYLLPLTFPVVWNVRPPFRWLAVVVSGIVGILAGCFGPSLLQPGPLRAFIWMASRLPAGEFILVASIAAVTVYNAIIVTLLIWDSRKDLVSRPLVSFALLAVILFIVEQLGVGGNVPFYDRYVLQIAPFLGVIGFSILPELRFARLLTLGVLDGLAHVILWGHAFHG